MLYKRLMWIIWPAFLMAGVMEVLVFSLADPQELSWFGQQLELSRQTVYTVSFFVFWLVLGLGGALTLLLSLSAKEINDVEAAKTPSS
ncbi:hypothetical protein [Rhodoferax saidenbachensis]|uniref:Transmembrane protein n=1 Tax=Rhodoferax saidenbachensis TaxID=1484693 RepID=A0A1P8KFR9_9BURK|nr:hypothetical protein [Rhodoferax saidenbachensis]APW44752.1 hypothetical protein RS694_07835 [Rhodoferax saidenbachensis]